MSDREDLIEQMVNSILENTDRSGTAYQIAKGWVTEDAIKMLPVVVRHITDKIRNDHSTFRNLCEECSDGEWNIAFPCCWIEWANSLDAEMGVER